MLMCRLQMLSEEKSLPQHLHAVGSLEVHFDYLNCRSFFLLCVEPLFVKETTRATETVPDELVCRVSSTLRLHF